MHGATIILLESMVQEGSFNSIRGETGGFFFFFYCDEIF
jgi:hypothetical protein